MHGPFTMNDAAAFTKIMYAVRLKTKVGLSGGIRYDGKGNSSPQVVTGQARYIGGRYAGERDFSAEATSDVRDLYLIIRVWSPQGECVDIPHSIADIIASYLAGTFVVDYQDCE